MAVKVHETGYGKWKVPVIIIAVIVVLGLAGTGILLSDSLGVSIEEGSKRIEVAEGDGTSSVAKLLKDNGIIKYPLLFKVQSKLGGYDGNFQPGAATIDDGMSYSDILNLIITPSREAAKITIPEGYEIKQIAQKLDEAGIVSWQDFYAALNPDDYDYVMDNDFRINIHGKSNISKKWINFAPIVEWKDEDVWLYILLKNKNMLQKTNK